MNLEEVLTQLEALGNERMRAQNLKNGANDNQYGVRLGDIRTLAKQIKSNHEFALELWATGNGDAQLLAILLLKPKQLSTQELEQMLRSSNFVQVADWLIAYVIKNHPEKEIVRESWMNNNTSIIARAGWQLTAERIAKTPDGLDLSQLLDRIKAEMASAPSEVQWTMNNSLAEIGIHFPEHRERAIAIGEQLGIYRDYPVHKGCTSPFAPIWINEIVRRQG